MKTYYAVTFNYAGQRMFAVRGNKPRGVFPPEPRCLFKTLKEAERLKKWFEFESTFRNITIESRDVK